MIVNTLLQPAFVAAMGMGGGLLTETTAYTIIWCWNKCTHTASGERKISKGQQTFINVCKIAGMVFFAALALRELNAMHPITKKIGTLKGEGRGLEKEVGDLFKHAYQSGKNAISGFQGPWK